MPDQIGKILRVAVEHIVVINTVNPAVNPDVAFPIDMVEVAMIDSHRCNRLDAAAAAAGYSNGSVVPGNGAAPVPERYPGKAKGLRRVKRDLDDAEPVRVMRGIVLDDGRIGNSRITCPSIYDR